MAANAARPAQLREPAPPKPVERGIRPWCRLPRDPRLLQLVFLGAILAGGALTRDFSVRPGQALLTFAAGVASQDLFGRAFGQPTVSYRSALITSLSLTILLRADNLWVHPAAAAAAVGSKYLFRIRGKHLFNPSCFGVIVALLAMPGTWVSPGQWGADVAGAGWIVALGSIVISRVRRGDMSWSFLAFYMGALALRVAWLGQSRAVWIHQFQSGALLLFAFFMISDPMTIPNDWRGRAAHAALVAAVAYAWTFWTYGTNGLVWALFLAAPAVPIWDTLWVAPKFNWLTNGGGNGTKSGSDARAVRSPDAGARADRPR